MNYVANSESRPSHELSRTLANYRKSSLAPGLPGDDAEPVDGRQVREMFRTARRALKALPPSELQRFARAAEQCTLGRYQPQEGGTYSASAGDIAIYDWVVDAVALYIANRDHRRVVMMYIAGMKGPDIGRAMGYANRKYANEVLARAAETVASSMPQPCLEI